MNGRPRNHRALCHAVSEVQHPEIDNTDKALLNRLALSGGALGENCRPGNAALERAASLKWSAVHVRLEKNIRRGLIQRTKVGDGRKNASVYRICWEHPAYPDISPNGRERYTENRPVDPDSKPENHPVTPDDSTETIRPVTGNHPVSDAKPSGQDTETIRPMDRTTSVTQQIPNQPTTRETPEWLVGFWTSHSHEPKLKLRKLDKLKGKAGDKEEILALIGQHGEEAVRWAWEAYVVAAPWNAETKCHVWPFLNDYETYACMGAERKIAVWHGSPEYIAQQRQYEIEMTQKLPPLPEGKTVYSECPAPEDLSELD
jgi:hypothetical protein